MSASGSCGVFPRRSQIWLDRIELIDWLGLCFIDIDAEQTLLNLFEGILHELQGFSRDLAVIAVEIGERRAAFAHHAEVFQILGGPGAGSDLLEHELDSRVHVPDRAGE